MISKEQLGKRIRVLRKKRKLTQEKLAERAGLHFKYLGEIERGIPTISLENLNKISAGLEVPLTTLLNIETELSRKELMEEVSKMMNDADDEQLKTIYQILTVIVR